MDMPAASRLRANVAIGAPAQVTELEALCERLAGFVRSAADCGEALERLANHAFGETPATAAERSGAGGQPGVVGEIRDTCDRLAGALIRIDEQINRLSALV